ncbi:hypothetical protein D5266_05230 [bacterium c-19]|nr:hypothetical protein [bacterium c-19]
MKLKAEYYFLEALTLQQFAFQTITMRFPAIILFLTLIEESIIIFPLNIQNNYGNSIKNKVK